MRFLLVDGSNRVVCHMAQICEESGKNFWYVTPLHYPKQLWHQSICEVTCSSCVCACVHGCAHTCVLIFNSVVSGDSVSDKLEWNRPC